MRWAAACTLGVLLCLSMGHTCGLEGQRQGLGAPCTRTRDCGEGLRCLAGMCDGRFDGGTRDGGTVDGGNDGTGDGGVADAGPGDAGG